MATPQLIPLQLFLSHSGTQKEFTRRLYHELLHVNHNPFFDQDAQDSLPKGQPFPSRIVEACRTCKLGIVVVSHEYIESLWPMLELQELLFHNPSSPNNVYPIFYSLKPADLFKQENLTRWQSTWDRKAATWHARVRDLPTAASGSSTSYVPPTLDISSWQKALEMLPYQNGEVLLDNKDEHAFIQTIVRNICKRLPPPTSFLMSDHIKGVEHIQQEIHELFQQQERIDDPRRMPVVLGIYGVGGSGKSTVCKCMLNFYNKEYPGSCYFLQLPSQEEDDQSSGLVKSMKVLLEGGNFAKESLDKINSVEQAMSNLQELLKRHKVFLVLDNVWDWALERAKQIATMQYIQGSKLLVTTRSERLLETLNSSISSTHINEATGRSPGMRIVHVPSISEDEAIEALMAYSLISSKYATNVEDLRGLARSCFFDKHCHPLLLKAVGAKLRHLGGFIRNAQDWTQLISRLQARRIHDDEEIEDTVLNVLRTSFDGLHSKLKNTFLALGTCVPKYEYSWRYESLSGASEWLSKLSAGGSQTIEDIRDELVELEYHGLIQIYKERIAIHDLQRMLIENIVVENSDVPRCFFFEGAVETLSASEWERRKYIHGFLNLPRRGLWQYMIGCSPCDLIGCFSFDGRAYTSPNWPNIEVLSLARSWQYIEGLAQLSMKYMQSLRHLELNGIHILEELGGWHGAPNLVSIKLENCRKLRKIRSMACLCKLESLVIKRCMRSGQYLTTNLSSCENLKRLVIEGNDQLTHVAILGHLPKLRDLSLAWCRNLVDVGPIFSAFPSLQRCDLSNTGILKLPELINSSNLEELDLQGCRNLESIPNLELLVKLRSVRLEGCHALIKGGGEVKVGDGAVTSVEVLGLQYYSCPSRLPISAFTNLRELWADGVDHEEEAGEWGSSGKISILDGAGRGNLPVSLEALHLMKFGIAQEFRGLSALVYLKELYVEECHSLTRITGLGALTKLQILWIRYCGRLREVGDWEAPFISHLEEVTIWKCPKLETLSTMRHLPFLKTIDIYKCPMVQEETLPRCVHKDDEGNFFWFLLDARD